MIPSNETIIFVAGWIVGCLQTIAIIHYLRGLGK